LDSLIDVSIAELRSNPEQVELLARLDSEGQAAMTAAERRARQRSLDSLDVPSFASVLADKGVTPLKRAPAKILQLNIGLYCNQVQCHPSFALSDDLRQWRSTFLTPLSFIYVRDFRNWCRSPFTCTSLTTASRFISLR
jgi:hypothetical protein